MEKDGGKGFLGSEKGPRLAPPWLLGWCAPLPLPQWGRGGGRDLPQDPHPRNDPPPLAAGVNVGMQPLVGQKVCVVGKLGVPTLEPLIKPL